MTEENKKKKIEIENKTINEKKKPSLNKKDKNGKRLREEIDFKYNLKVYWSLLRNYKWLVAVILIIVLVQESRHVWDRFLFKILVDKGSLFIAGELVRAEFASILFILAVIFVASFILGAISSWLNVHIVNKLDSRLIFDLKKKFFNHLITLDHNFHTTHKSGSLISRLLRGGGAVERMTDSIIYNFAPLILQLTIVIISLIYIDWVPALVMVITMIVFILFNFTIQRLQEESNLIANRKEDIEKANVADIFTNIDSIKYYGKEKWIQNKFSNLSNDTKNAYMKNWNYFRWMSAGQSLILGVGVFLIIYFPLMKFLNGGISLGTLTFIYTTYVGLTGPLFGFVGGIRNYYRAMADFQDLFQYGKISKEIIDKEDAKDLKIEKGEVEFKDISFNYGKRKLFRNFSLKIKPNQKVALVGHSGCGKSTLVKLLYRLYNVDNGNILIDGQDISILKQESLRSEMAIVPQEAILFDDTIYNNIKFSNPTASRKEVMAAIKFAQLDKIIKNFPKKEQTIVGERGVKLSGGEKQRVSIARAILANKKVLVLDEATSALDSETEHEIQRDLAKLMVGRTSIIIAHRLSTIMHADIIVVMKNGKIVQMGNHNDLINQDGEYKKLWNLQKGGYLADNGNKNGL